MARNDSLRRGNNIEMLILSILSTEDCYGYQLSLLIKDYSQGKISLPEGSLYPALYKLVDNGLISDEKRQVGKRLTRVYYHMEPEGKDYLNQLIEEYNSLHSGIQSSARQRKETNLLMFKKRNDFDQYLKNIRISFPVFHKAERRFFQDFSANVREYQAIHPMSTLSDLEEEFGRPKDIIMDYFYNMNSSSYLLYMKRARYLRIITASVIIFLIAGTIIESYFYYTLYKEWATNEIKSEQTVIYYLDE